MEVNEALADKLARLEYLLSRNSGNSSSCSRATTTRVSSRRGEEEWLDGRRGGGKQPGARVHIWRG